MKKDLLMCILTIILGGLIGGLVGIRLQSNRISTNSEPETKHCLDIYSGGKLIWEGEAERNHIAHDDGSVEFINKITNEPMLVHSDFVYYVCHEVKEEEVEK